MSDPSTDPPQPVLYCLGAVYGFCPRCGAPGEMRDHKGRDRCQNGHSYTSLEAVAHAVGRVK